jgi:Tfp pilus assembly protein PilO
MRIILGIVAAILILLWYNLGYTPVQKELAVLHNQVAASQAQLDDFQTTVAQLPHLIKASAELSEQKQRQASVLFGKNEVLRLVDEISANARVQHLTIVEIEPPVSELLALRSSAATPGEPLFLNITVRIKGDYVGFGQFVELMERLPYYRGANFCSILGTPDQANPPVFSLGFKALLGEGGRG